MGAAELTTLRDRAPGKVNLCLLVGAPRADGYHPIVSVIQSVSLADELTLEPAAADQDEVICPGVPGKNIAARALALFRAETGWDGPPQRLTIDKRVPVAAGMGGGSADAAAALRLLARAAGLPADDPALARIAPRLGADVPSQLTPGRTLVSGIGEVVERLAPGPPGGLLILPSRETLPTPAVYAQFDAACKKGVRPLSCTARSAADLAAARHELARGGPVPPLNDLEPAACSLCPAIDGALEAARAAGADHAMVAGSGPTVFGWFPDLAAAERAAGRSGWPGAVAAAPVEETA